MIQMTLDFEPGLTQRYPRWEDTFITAVYASRMGLNGVAAECDQSPSELSKRLNNDAAENRPLRANDIISILDSTKDFTPIYWLIERFLKDPESKKQEALARLPGLIEQLNAVLETAGAAKVRAVK